MYCHWVDLKDQVYVRYHDEEWGKLQTDDRYLFEMLTLEIFQAGLSWKCVLDKRAYFIEAYDHFDLDKVCKYDKSDIERLLNDERIIKNKRKIIASIRNAQIFKEIVAEYGSFYAYLETFTHGRIFFETDKVTNKLSDMIAKDLKDKGMGFVGSITIYAYLQAIGIIDSHEKSCYLYKDISLYERAIDDLAFEGKIHMDALTMSYNAGYELDIKGYDKSTGTIYFSSQDLLHRYQKRKENGNYLAYIKENTLDEYIGIVDIHKEGNKHYIGIVIKSEYRHKGYFKKAMYLLLEEASKRNIDEVYDVFESDRAYTLEAFEKVGFKVDRHTKIKKDGRLVDGVVVKLVL